MDPLLTCIVAALVLFGGATLGRVVRNRLPGGELHAETKDLVRVAIGFLATLAALVLGLLISSAKDGFVSRVDEVQTFATNIILLDQELTRIGPEANTARLVLKKVLSTNQAADSLIDGSIMSRRGEFSAVDELIRIQETLRGIKPQGDARALALNKALQIIDQLILMRWQLAAHSESKIPPLAVIILVAWCAIIAAGLNLFAPRDAMMRVVSAVNAFAIASAIFLALEMDQPFDGMIRVSDAPLRAASQVLQH
jgi:hypothetical protein